MKPAQCCIKLVFHLTYTMMHGSIKLKFCVPYLCITEYAHTYVTNQQMHINKMFHVILLFIEMFRSLLQLSSGCHTGTQTIYKQETSSLLYTTGCKHSLALPRMGEIVARNVFSWLKLLIILLLLCLVGCLYYCIIDALLHKHQKHTNTSTESLIKTTHFHSCLLAYLLLGAESFLRS